MAPYRMDDYERAVARHRLESPATFNFGADVVDAWARDPSKLALIWCDASGTERRLTFDEVARASNRVANRLAGRGVEKGDRVVVMLPRIPEWQIALTACLKLGAVPIPCIAMLTERDVAWRVRHSGAVAAITLSTETAKFGDAASFKARIAVGPPCPGWEAWQDNEMESESFAAPTVKAEAPAIMYYTSGSTGAPKGVLHASRGLHAWRVSAWYWLTLTSGDTMWCTADTGWSKAGTSIYFGPGARARRCSSTTDRSMRAGDSSSWSATASPCSAPLPPSCAGSFWKTCRGWIFPRCASRCPRANPSTPRSSTHGGAAPASTCSTATDRPRR